MVCGRKLFAQPLKIDIGHMITLEKLLQVEETTMQLVAYLIIHTSKKTIS